MELRSTLIHDKLSGFTLIELIIAIGLIGLIATFGLLLSMDFYRGSTFRSELATVVSVVQKARGQALANINEMNHGAHYDSGTNCDTYDKCYIIFEGNSFNPAATSNVEIEASNAVTVDWTTDILFNQLDGSANTVPVTITLTQADKIATITTNAEGRINW